MKVNEITNAHGGKRPGSGRKLEKQIPKQVTNLRNENGTLLVTCPCCHAEIEAGSNYCNVCGQAVKM